MVIIYFRTTKAVGKKKYWLKKKRKKILARRADWIFSPSFGDYLSLKHNIFLPDLEESNKD